MKKIEGPIKLTVKEGDAYYDAPVTKNKPLYCGKEQILHPVLDHYRRTPLRWMAPDGRGGIKPRAKNADE